MIKIAAIAAVCFGIYVMARISWKVIRREWKVLRDRHLHFHPQSPNKGFRVRE